MIKVDLITGFLGSGKTTFLKQYAKYLLDKGEKIAIIENDFGAINVDMMLLSDLEGENCWLEMVAGGYDADCHKRRFKTKLIAMGMRGFDRVIVEPSGIFDTDEFFDSLREEPLDSWYEIGNVITIVDSKTPDILSADSEYILASEIASCGIIITSKLDSDTQDISNVINHINKALKSINCNRVITNQDIIKKPFKELNIVDYEKIESSGYKPHDFIKKHNLDTIDYSSIYFMNHHLTLSNIKAKANTLFDNKEYGNIVRIKGFINENNKWYEINLTKTESNINEISNGQSVVIIIGEDINEDKIKTIID